jgi:hypothetical protein
MCKGISILRARIKQELFDEYELAQRIHQRGEQQELHFMYSDKFCQLPILDSGELRIVEWGNRSRKGKLPPTGWCRIESVEAGKWRWLKPEKVVIPADFGLEKGVWFQITEGMEGLLVEDEQHKPRVYMLTQAASHYYEVMTRHDRMPILVGQDI